MPFIGNQPAEKYSSFQKQDFTTSATTSYTLDHPVANGNEIALFINFVRQEPTAAYTASGTSLTLTSATTSSDDMYCVYLGKAVQTVNPPNSSVGTSQLDSSLDFSSKTITLASNMKNTPSFFASKTDSNQTATYNTWTKVTFNNETYDTDSAFSDSKFTVPSGEAGKYCFTAQVVTQQGSVLLRTLLAGYYKNGSSLGDFREIETRTDSPLYEFTLNKSIILDLSAGDYIEFYIKVQTTTGTPDATIRSGSTTNFGTYFMGYKLIGV
jgi:hypothetical protein